MTPFTTSIIILVSFSLLEINSNGFVSGYLLSGYLQYRWSSFFRSSRNLYHKKNRLSKNGDINEIVQKIGLKPSLTPIRKKNEKMNHTSSLLIPIPRHIDVETQLSFSREGHAVLRSFLPPSFLLSLRTELETIVHQESLAAWQQKVAVATNSLSEKCQTIEQCQKQLISLGLPTDIPFLQFFNTWRKLSSVEAICKSPLLASAASQLMGIPRVRLYQDSLFVKRWKDGKTPWHIDARMSPFDTQHFLTFWIPLQPIHSNGGTALLFVNKTHSDIALPYWNDIDGKEYQRLDHRYSSTAIHHYMPMELGDVTVHSGWTLHCADANISNNNKKKQSTSEDRYALAVTYVDARAEIREDVVKSVAKLKQKSSKNKNEINSKGDNEDTSSFLPWIHDVKPRTQFNHHLVPLVWPTIQD